MEAASQDHSRDDRRDSCGYGALTGSRRSHDRMGPRPPSVAIPHAAGLRIHLPVLAQRQRRDPAGWASVASSRVRQSSATAPLRGTGIRNCKHGQSPSLPGAPSSCSVCASRPTRDIDGVLAPGPAVVVCRHVSLLDASLPSLLYQRIGYQTRGVIMAELLADPGFDLLYQRAGSVFIVRDSSPEARNQTASIGEGLNNKSVAIIFPEGRLFRPEVLRRSLGRLAERDPERARNLETLRHLLPHAPPVSSPSWTCCLALTWWS